MNYKWYNFLNWSEFSKYLNRALKVKRFCRFLQYQRRGIGELVLKYQQATPLESAGMPLWLGLIPTAGGECND